MLTRIRNAQMRSLNNVKIPNSKFRAKILDVLKREGYISDYKVLSDFLVVSSTCFGMNTPEVRSKLPSPYLSFIL